MIEAEYLAALRRRLRTELVLTLVQLEQLCPGWWADVTELAQQLGTDRASLNRSLTKLERLGLLRRETIGNSGGNWVWWVKRTEDDEPRSEDEPAWVLRDLETRKAKRVPVSRRWQWAASHGIKKNTFSAFLNGGQTVLHGRWRVERTPWDTDVTECEERPD